MTGYRMDLDNGIEYLKKKDAIMKEIINLVGNYCIQLRPDPYLVLVESIIYQQLTGRAAHSIYQRFVNHYNDVLLTPEKVLSTSSETMKSFGLSNKKIEYIKLLSKNITEKNFNLQSVSTLDDEEIINQLTKMKGIGRWTADMFLIFCLGRKDVFPIHDLGIKKAIQKWYLKSTVQFPPTKQKMLEISQVWKPYRSIATWYLWKSLSKFDTIG